MGIRCPQFRAVPMGSAPWHKGASQAPETSAPIQAPWGAFGQPGGNMASSRSLVAPTLGSPPHGARP